MLTEYNLQSPGSASRLSGTDVRDTGGDGSSASSRGSSPEPPTQTQLLEQQSGDKPPIPPRGAPPPTPTRSPSMEGVTLRNKLAAAGEC